jgi:sterol desaturase/sphingolipid hydroxylase (fatty acid hydroxylase superfamily)
VTETGFQIARIVGFVLALGLATGLQRVAPYARLPGSWRTNGALWAINAVVVWLVCGACACSVARWAAAHGVGVLNVAPPPAWFGLPVTILALDLVSYGWHRATHGVPLLWRFHRVHHSDLSFTVSTALRFHPGELLLSLPLRLTAVALLGASVAAVASFEILFNVANLVEHGNIRLPGSLERRLALMCVTPALHRHHHSRRVAELNSNFGTICTLWDRLFGTYGAATSSDQVDTGLPGATRQVDIRRALVMPLSL